MELACATGIAPEVWAAEGEQAIVTAIDVLRVRGDRHDGDDERQMSG